MDTRRNSATILIIENDLATINLVRPALECAGYRVHLAAPSGGLAAAFTNATAADETGTVYDVEVSDADELSTRLAAAIAGGARIVAVTPRHEDLEERVRRALAEGR